MDITINISPELARAFIGAVVVLVGFTSIARAMGWRKRPLTGSASDRAHTTDKVR